MDAWGSEFQNGRGRVGCHYYLSKCGFVAFRIGRYRCYSLRKRPKQTPDSVWLQSILDLVYEHGLVSSSSKSRAA